MQRLNDGQCLALLNACQAIITDSHFVYAKPEGRGYHGAVYVNKDLLYPNVDVVSHLCHEMAHRLDAVVMNDFGDSPRIVVVGPEKGAIILQTWLTHWLKRIYGKDVQGVYAEKRAGGGFEVKRGYDRIVKAATKIIVVEDILNSGGTVREVVDAIEALGKSVAAVAAICNRGGVTEVDVGVNVVESLVTLKLEKFPEDECPICRAGLISVRTDLGHGREFLARRAQK